ncbi:hypothetical protein CSC73_05750 [Pseudoxanthomonas sacheonensis]|nr:hypothetical protein CSC73_05750 [Pseudoxanthomonas sacheonensis]
MQTNLLKPKSTTKKWLAALALVGNLAILARYFLASAVVLLGLRGEALTGQSYDWPMRVVIVSAIVFVLTASLLIAMLPLWRDKWKARLVVCICIFGIASIEIIESILVYITYRPFHLYEWNYYLYGPLMIAWGVVNLFVLKFENRRPG